MGFAGITPSSTGLVGNIKPSSILGGNNLLKTDMTSTIMGKLPNSVSSLMAATGLDSCIPSINLKLPDNSIDLNLGISKIDCSKNGIGSLSSGSDMLGSIFGGAALGAIAGQLIGKDTKSTLIGAVVGGSLGAATSLLSSEDSTSTEESMIDKTTKFMNTPTGSVLAGSAAGALVGQVAGGNTKSTIIGAGIGALAGSTSSLSQPQLPTSQPVSSNTESTDPYEALVNSARSFF